MFHTGASIAGEFPNLVGDAKDGRSFKVSDLDDFATKKDELQKFVIAWCDQKDG